MTAYLSTCFWITMAKRQCRLPSVVKVKGRLESGHSKTDRDIKQFFSLSRVALFAPDKRLAVTGFTFSLFSDQGM